MTFQFETYALPVHMFQTGAVMLEDFGITGGFSALPSTWGLEWAAVGNLAV